MGKGLEKLQTAVEKDCSQDGGSCIRKDVLPAEQNVSTNIVTNTNGLSTGQNLTARLWGFTGKISWTDGKRAAIIGI